jgi:hypothetical protein
MNSSAKNPNPLTRIRITFRGNVLSVSEVISFVSSLNYIPSESTFRILVIALISA